MVKQHKNSKTLKNHFFYNTNHKMQFQNISFYSTWFWELLFSHENIKVHLGKIQYSHEKIALGECTLDALGDILDKFLMDSGTQKTSKKETRDTPNSPQAPTERFLDIPGIKKASRNRCLVVEAQLGIDFERILASKRSLKCFQQIQHPLLSLS